MRSVIALLMLLAPAAPAQTRFEFWPGAKYDPAIPSIEKVLGYEVGTRHPAHAELLRYFEALQAAAPGRIKIFEYGKTFEGRKLIYAVVASEENLRRLEQIKAAQKKLADPRKTTEAEARKLAAETPAVVALICAIHGNEISGPDSAMVSAYHLLAAQGDALVDSVRKNAVVLIDPLQNPDGRDRFVQSFRQNEGLEPDASPVAAERAEPWPGGRSNHYLFDLNRDWFTLTQPEIRGRVKYLLDWLPVAVADIHEMGADSTYFFAPWPAPNNPNVTREQVERASLFGKNNAKWFVKFGWPYFTREVFDLFFPGYGGSWPSYLGGLGMTYENASVRGLVVRRSDETLYTFRESVQKHFVASMSTCETAAANRGRLLEEFRSYHVTALEEGQKGAVKEYILPRRGDVSAVDKLAHVLVEQGVEVRRAKAAFTSAGKEYPAGSYAVSLGQPRQRLARTLLDAQTAMAADFVKEQERRRKKGLSSEIYDVTAWSLPELYNVECVGSAEAAQGAFEMVSGAYAPKGVVSGKAQVAYVVPWGTQAAGRFLTAALRSDLKVLSAGKAFTQGGRKYPSGTLIVMVKQNAADVHERVAKAASASGAEVIVTDTSWVEEGINFGSNNVAAVKKPVVAMLWDTPVSSTSAGHTRFVLERQYGYPVTAMRVSSLATADLNRFQVLIMPEGGYGAAIPAAAVERLKAWVRNGGVLIGIGSAAGYLSSPAVALLGLEQEAQARDGAKPAESVKPAAPGAPPPPGKILVSAEDYEKAIKADVEMPDAVAGVLLRAKVDPETWVTSGLPETVNVLLSGRTIYAPLKRDKGVNAVVFEAADRLLASGYVWEENRK
ncbi:MAG: peptidase M14, partial [Candidatus Solibacter usitatus]|nr:peptidase M14 [Candidatus Solibacter usitatus]